MTITTTAISFFLSSLGSAFCGIYFFKAFQKIGTSETGKKIGILLSGIFLCFAIQLGTLAIGALFFIGKPGMFYALLIAHFLLVLVAIVGVYLFFYILFPLISPWPSIMGAFILGAIVIILLIMTDPHPLIDAGGGVDWNFSRLFSVFLSYLLFLDLGIVLTLFAHSFLQAKSRDVKIVSLIQVVLSGIGIVNIFMRFLLPKNSRISELLRTQIFDVTLAMIGIIFIAAFFLSPIMIKKLFKMRHE